MPKLVSFRCDKCAAELDGEYFTCENGEQVPIDDVEIVYVPQKNCECSAKNPKKHMTTVRLDKADEEPWEVVFWEDDYDRDQGISSYFGSYESFDDAYIEAIRGARINDWASCEVQLNTGETTYAVYCYATTEPRADEFVI